jgi:quinone-modifying oxidoreductase subunit QmoC
VISQTRETPARPKKAVRFVTAPDYGFRLHGKRTSVLPDRSFDLTVPPHSGTFTRRHAPAMRRLEACLQCGACTATCDLARDDMLFPRRQLALVRLGLEDRAAEGPEIWKCYACTDCTAKCPSNAKPDVIMRRLRQLAIERFAYPRPLARAVAEPVAFVVVCAIVALVVAGLVALGGSFSPAPGPIDYAGMLPNPVLIPIFSGLSVLPLVAIGVGAARAWRSWYGSSLQSMRPAVLWASVKKAAPEIVTQRQMAGCQGHRMRSWAHRAIVGAVAGLLVASAVMTALVVVGQQYPLSMGNPLKILANVFAALLIGGTSYFLWLRIAEASRGERVGFFDWAFLSSVFLAGVTGAATEAMRAADIRPAAYPTYFVHLVIVLVLILTLPYTKLAHAVYRVLALAGEEYAAAERAAMVRPGTSALGGAGAQDRAAPGDGAPARGDEPASPSPEELLTMSHAELAQYPDAVLEDAYYKLRDQNEPRHGGRYYPNMKRLAASALEREKDRREVDALVHAAGRSEWEEWYQTAAEQPCTWWLENHIVARHALTTCLNCGMCTSVCPAAEHFEDYDPRVIVDTALSGDEERIVDLLKSNIIWYCAQCGSCNSRCPHSNDIMNLVGSLRTLAQLKGYHTQSVRGRQQYAGRQLWAANLWNRAVSLYFRDPSPVAHPDFGPRYAGWWADLEEEFARAGGTPDMDGAFAGRKVTPETLAELRSCIRAGGALVLWQKIEEHAAADAARLGLDIDDYLNKVSTEG